MLEKICGIIECVSYLIGIMKVKKISNPFTRIFLGIHMQLVYEIQDI